MNSKLFMTNIANQNNNKTIEDEFKATQLPAPDVLRVRFDSELKSY